MSEIKDGGPAFPVPEPGLECGMTMRDYFAAKAMDACVSAVPPESSMNVDNVARFSYTMADAMLRARSQS